MVMLSMHLTVYDAEFKTSMSLSLCSICFQYVLSCRWGEAEVQLGS